MILRLQQGLLDEGIRASLSQLCCWFEVPRRTVYYQPTKAAPKVDEQLAAHLPNQRLAGAQVPGGHATSHTSLAVGSQRADQRWATDLFRIWTGRDGWASLALVIDCYTRELLGWQLSRIGKASTAASALDQGLIARSGTLGKIIEPFLLRSDNVLVFAATLRPW